ncbi:MAG: hypothetical protein AB7S78_09270 [Candidatus Omnitrophota bacterium]
MDFGPAKITGSDRAAVQKIFRQLAVDRDYVNWIQEPDHPESVRVRINPKDVQFGGYIFDFMKLTRPKYFVFNQYAWLIQVIDGDPRPGVGWSYLPGQSPLDFLWVDDCAERIKGLTESGLLKTGSAGEAIRLIEAAALWLHLNGRGYGLCLLAAAGLFWLTR